MRGAWISGGLVALALACSESPFTCDDDGDCSGLGEGRCEADGYCSVPDDTCPSRRRYAGRSGARSHECVRDDQADGGSETGRAESTTGEVRETTSFDPENSTSGTPGSEDVGEASSDATSIGDDTGTSTDGGLILRVTFDDPSFAAVGGASDIGPYALSVSCAEASCPSPTTGVVGGAAAFDGTQRLDVRGDGVLDVPGDLTIALWVRDLAADATTTRVVFSRLLGSAYAASYELDFYDSMLVAAIAADGNAQVLATAPYAEVDNGWVHYALIVDGPMLRLYRNAQEVASAPGLVIGYENTTLVVGCDEDAGADYNDYFIGELDDLRMYDRALSQIELATILAGM